MKATLGALTGTLLMGTVALAQTPVSLPAGQYRGEFQTSSGAIPFNFEVQVKNNAAVTVYLLNANEREELTGTHAEGDSIVIPIPLYDASLRFKRSGQLLTGIYRAGQGRPIPVTAAYGRSDRFEKGAAPTVSLTGKWEIGIQRNPNDPNDVNQTVGVFTQTGSRVTGTILTTTGDYRYLDGQVTGNEFRLSAFSGSSPSVFQGTIQPDGSLTGTFRYIRGTIPVTGKKNDGAKLPDLYSLTQLKPGYNQLAFTFPDLTGKPVSLTDAKYKDKVVVVTILGSWCPNCIDEAAFLAPWYKANRQRGVEIIGLAFERKNDLAFARTALSRLINRFDVQYDILFAGLADKKAASDALPALNRVLAFPTTIILDRQGKVAQIHTGYTGPATGSYYDAYVAEFNQTIDKLLKNEPVPAATGGR
ncbi:peroxiredoxin family protein [Spirosoma sordidisoli]|uniref:TlpA family protein disulfide reductase n=1 Tax=Spirosoma sordidisoli TaxID=2502893 RepID=A0A4Q2UPD4_9BACT|nr:TlpA disulfide reductase family protein [Spirosoma sordidisoli]RYC69480.1 TlpA family protein disulfide reductase [Spirosoma sordidisoli]